MPSKELNLPGTSAKALVMLPIRVALWAAVVSFFYPIFLIAATLRALYLKLVYGPPSKILKYGTHNAAKWPDFHYPAHVLFDKTLDETKLKDALVGLCAEDGITAEKVEVVFHHVPPNDWAENGSWPSDHYHDIIKGKDHGFTYWDAAPLGKGTGHGNVVKVHVFNAVEEGKPTLMFYGGCGNAWDGSSNFNFVKELMSRYVGNKPNNVFQKPEVLAESAAKMDEGSFLYFLAKMPFNIAMQFLPAVWNLIRTSEWAGGNGVGWKLCAMNFTVEESAQLYQGCKAIGIKPFAAFTYAGVKAAKEVFGEQPTAITQQASLQTRHYPAPNQGSTRDLVGDWLIGPMQTVPAGKYTTDDAQKAYGELYHELKDIGERTRNAIWGKAYGIFNSGAAGFELMPFYNDYMHVWDKTIFMNNYGVRTVDEKAGFVAWNWNAPLWLGINTINVNGRTTTMVGSCFYGTDLVHACRDNIEGTLRDIMAKAPK